MANEKTTKKRDRIGITLYLSYLFVLGLSLVVLGKVIYLQVFFSPDAKKEKYLTPLNTLVIKHPNRGRILDCKGRVLASSYPVYRLHVDCTVGKSDVWKAEVDTLCLELPEYLPGKTSKEYHSLLMSGRNNGKKYLELAKDPVDYATLSKLRELHLFRLGQNKGGLIAEQESKRRYPYDSVARRTIGFIREGQKDIEHSVSGIEGRYNYLLQGKCGREWLRVSDNGEKVRNTDSLEVEAVDGQDIRLTLNVDTQIEAEKCLRRHIQGEEPLVAACLVLMEVQTGAIRAMVNLERNPNNGRFEERNLVALGRRYEPGSVFKTVTLTSVLTDNYIHSLNETLPTNKGIVEGTTIPQDEDIRHFDGPGKSNRISILDGLRISSNYVFATLAINCYKDKPEQFVQRLYSYKLGEEFKFEIDGLVKPRITIPCKGGKTNLSELGYMGFGYNTEETPLHILTFYNAIGAGGKMSKPYLVGEPEILNATICTKAVADTVTRALKAVTGEKGTARRLNDAAVKVAGKTGTSFGTFDKKEQGKNAYVDKENRQKYQGTFVGFFPADDPQYSVICTIFSKATQKNNNYHGGVVPALVVKDLVNYLYKTDPYWRKDI